jgi:putative long chain acyl-CoA synthase
MGGRPSYLSLATALSRLGAVAVLLRPDAGREALERAIGLSRVGALIADPENASLGRAAFDGGVFVLGGGGDARTLPESVVDMEAIDPDAVELPDWFEPNPGRACDLAMVILTLDRSGEARAAHITNHRWAFSAIGAAAACTLTPKDTVYCGLPLHHAAGTLVATGAALVGGSRLALASQFSPETFWSEVRRYGATVVFYAGAMCRALANAPYARSEKNHPVRLFAGSGMRADAWQRLVDRFGPVGVLEFYATTEGNVVLANASGEKVGAVGRPLPGSAEIAIVAYDFEALDFKRDADGKYVRCDVDEPGMLIAKVDRTPPRETQRLRRGVFEDDDTWFFTGDILRCDADGDYWFIDRFDNMIVTEEGPVSTVRIEDALHKVADVELAVAYGVRLAGSAWAVPVATIKLREGATLDGSALREVVDAELEKNARPRYIRCASEIAMTDGFRPLKAPLRKLGIEAADGAVLLAYESGYQAG